MMISHLNQNLRQGFTLVEAILVVTVLAILLGVSTPAIYGFIKQRDIQEEQNMLQELRKALQAYLADRNALPPVDNPATTTTVEWADALAGYTNLSTQALAIDMWGTPRAYIQTVDTTRNIQGAPVAINYATFLSAGPDKEAAADTGIAVVNNAFADSSNPQWWASNPSVPQRVLQFGTLATEGDDLMVKFTDYPEKLERYNLTLQRLDRIVTAVETLARTNYSEVVSDCASLPRDGSGLTGNTYCDTPGAIERFVYYPIGYTNFGESPALLHRYEQIYQDQGTPAADQVLVNNSGTDTQRRADMVKLMRLLGLPDDFCCSALELGTDNLPKPFYYFSNPRPRGISGGCGARPGFDDQKLPARLATTNNDSPPSGAPTCG